MPPRLANRPATRMRSCSRRELLRTLHCSRCGGTCALLYYRRTQLRPPVPPGRAKAGTCTCDFRAHAPLPRLFLQPRVVLITVVRLRDTLHLTVCAADRACHLPGLLHVLLCVWVTPPCARGSSGGSADDLYDAAYYLGHCTALYSDYVHGSTTMTHAPARRSLYCLFTLHTTVAWLPYAPRSYRLPVRLHGSYCGATTQYSVQPRRFGTY